MSDLVNCKKCGNKISRNSKNCPKCGEPNKKKTSIILWVFIIVAGVSLLSEIISMNNDASNSSSNNENKKLTYSEQKDYFDKNKYEIVKSIESILNQNRLEDAWSRIIAYKKYNDEDILKLENKIKKRRTDFIEKKLKAIPSSEYYENYLNYQKLLDMHPASKTYKTKRDTYKNKYELEKAFFGDKPTLNSWDNSYLEVKNYLKYTMKDPDSLDIRECSSVYKIDNVGWAVHCSYRGKNSFGAVVLNSNWFIIRNNNVVKIEPTNAYSIK